MQRELVGVVLAGTEPLLRGLAGENDAALTPFAGQYRLLDFALATLANCGVTASYVAAPVVSPALRIHLGRAARARSRRPSLLTLPAPGGAPATPGARLAAVLATRRFPDRYGTAAVVLLGADHVLQFDVRQVYDVHRASRADVTLIALSMPAAERGHYCAIGSLLGSAAARGSSTGPATTHSLPHGFAWVWAGDMIVSASAFSPLLDALRQDRAGELPAILADTLRVVVYDVGENRLPGCGRRLGAYWHAPISLESYYDAHMNLCTPRPSLDLHNPAWPPPAMPCDLGPARIVTDAAGRSSHVLNTLVSGGSLVRGATVINAVLGRGVVIESGAEVEDCVLLDGCRVGRGARVRRAIVGAGAVVTDGAQVGYGRESLQSAHVAPSGLTLVPSAAPTVVPLAAGAA
jgi:glucose-1-phosphate adenylyltransferase